MEAMKRRYAIETQLQRIFFEKRASNGARLGEENKQARQGKIPTGLEEAFGG
jgi:hypothetical protein